MIYRRVDDAFLDLLVFRGDSVLGVAGERARHWHRRRQGGLYLCARQSGAYGGLTAVLSTTACAWRGGMPASEGEDGTPPPPAPPAWKPGVALLVQVQDACRWVRSEFAYEPNRPPSASLNDLLAQGGGSAADLAHVLTLILRSWSRLSASIHQSWLAPPNAAQCSVPLGPAPSSLIGSRSVNRPSAEAKC